MCCVCVCVCMCVCVHPCLIALLRKSINRFCKTQNTQYENAACHKRLLYISSFFCILFFIHKMCFGCVWPQTHTLQKYNNPLSVFLLCVQFAQKQKENMQILIFCNNTLKVFLFLFQTKHKTFIFSSLFFFCIGQ